MRITLAAAAFTTAAFLPTTSHAQPSDAGEAGTSTTSDAGAPAEVSGGASGSLGAAGSAAAAGKGGTGGAAATPAPGPAPNLPDPGTDSSNSCSFSGPRGRLGVFGGTLLLGVTLLVLRRRRAL